MFELKFIILKTLYNSPFREAHQSILFSLDKDRPLEIRNAIKDLVIANLIEPVIGSEKYHLTSPGANFYEQSQQNQKQSAEIEKQYRFSKRATIISVIVGLITLLISIIELSLHLFDFI